MKFSELRSLCFWVLSGAAFFFTACHPRPVEDMALADVAIKAAQKSKADALAPDVYRQAENYYLRAKKDYSDGYFDSSKKFANQARMLAEQAEYRALKKQTQMKSKGPDEELDASKAVPSPNSEALPLEGN